LVPVMGKPVLGYVFDDLLGMKIKDITMVVGYLGEQIIDFAKKYLDSSITVASVLQPKRLGIAHAVYRVLEESFFDEEFVVYLGDNFLSDGAKEYVKSFFEHQSDVHILLSRVKDPRRFGVVVLDDNGQIKKLVEKPREPISNLALVGVYFFRDPKLYIKGFKSLKPSWRGEYEITELIQWFVNKGYKITYSIVEGWWKDIGTPESLLELVYMLLDKADTRIEGRVEGEIYGKVIIEKGAIIEGSVYGPAYIGKNVFVDSSARIEHYVDLEQGVKVYGGSLSRVLVLDNTRVILGKARLIDSVLGAHSSVEVDTGTYKLILGERSLVKK